MGEGRERETDRHSDRGREAARERELMKLVFVHSV